jgi:hypothetical protein
MIQHPPQLMLLLRVWNLTVQEAYTDAGYHIRSALEVWSFDQNPGRFAHGKMLLYFWVGIFARFAEIDSILWISRLAMAVFSIVTGLAIYVLVDPGIISGGVDDDIQPSFGRMVEYARGLFPLIADFTSWGFLAAAVAALLIGLGLPILDSTRTRFVLMLVQWITLLVLPTWLMASLITARYFVPVLPPLCLLLAVVITSAWCLGPPFCPRRHPRRYAPVPCARRLSAIFSGMGRCALGRTCHLRTRADAPARERRPDDAGATRAAGSRPR